MADISQTFLLIATFDIALISIAIAVYAVSASYLGRETRLTRWRLQKRKDLLNKKIKELQEKGNVEIKDLKKEIKKAEKERDQLGNRVFLLSWNGAVIVPCISFIISLVLAVLGMNLDEGYLTQLVTSPLFLALGFVSLMVVIGTIDSAARYIPLPEFDVFFENHGIPKLKQGKKTILTFYVHNKGESLAENVQIFIFFPSTFSVEPHPDYKLAIQSPETDYPNHIAVVANFTYMHVDICKPIGILLTPPNDKKKYEIPVEVCESKIGESKHKLIVEVTD